MRKAVKQSFTLVGKAMALLLMAVYILFSVGIIKATHFCMGREASVQFFTSETKKCPCSLYAKEKSSCCDDEHEVIRIDDEQKTIAGISAPLPIWKIERIFTERLLTFTISSSTFDVCDESQKSPPKVPIWKANSSYVFYEDGSDDRLVS
jgi:hypothetical protein